MWLWGIAVALIVLYLYLRDPRSDKRVPMPFFNWPIIGNLPYVWANRGNELKTHQKHAMEHKSYYLVLPAPIGCELVITDVPSIQYILENVDLFMLSPIRKRLFGDVFGNGIFMADGESWKLQRALAKPIFNLDARTDMFKAYHRSGDILIEKLREAAVSGETVDIQTVFKRFTLDTFSEIGFGYRVDSLISPVPFSDAFEQTLVEADEAFKNPLRRLFNAKEYRATIDTLESFVYGIIKERRQDPKVEEKQDMLSRLLAMERSGEIEGMTDTFLRDQLVNFFIAGRDTTAVLLTWLNYFLALHPDVYDKIEEEIRTVLGNNIPTLKETKELKYLHMALDEALRLYPPAVPFNSKTASADTVLPNGINIKKGDSVVYSAYTIHRLPEYWGKDCELFKPERWAEPGLIKHPYQYLAFQKGPRVCLGMNMAYEEAKCCMAMLVQAGIKFTLDQKQNVLPHATAILQARHGVKMFVSQK